MSCFTEAAIQVRYTSRDQWLERRRSGIGASDIAGVLGLSPYTTPLQVWASKLVDLPDDPSEAMEWGRRLEPVILDAWQLESRRRVVHRGALLRSRKRPWMMATLDGVTRTNMANFDESDMGAVKQVPAVVQAKAVSDWTWNDIVPQHYQLQVQWEMAVTGFELAFVVVLHSGRRLAAYEVFADPVVQAELIEEGEQFWSAVESGEPPAVDADDLSFLNDLFPTSHEQAVEIPVDAMEELYESRRAFVAASDRKAEAEAAVKAMLGEYDTAVVDQTVIATWKTNDRRGVDIGRLRAELPHVADRYTIKTTERRFLVKGEKE